MYIKNTGVVCSTKVILRVVTWNISAIFEITQMSHLSGKQGHSC